MDESYRNYAEWKMPDSKVCVQIYESTYMGFQKQQNSPTVMAVWVAVASGLRGAWRRLSEEGMRELSGMLEMLHIFLLIF